MAEVNAHGLGRYIPAEVRREVRRRCGFGCVICGSTITQYEHFLPDFADASTHDPAAITLLCLRCHGMVTKGVIPKEQVSDANRNPAALSSGYSREEHLWFRGVPSLSMGGGALVHNTPVPLEFRGRRVIQFDPPEEDAGVALISATFTDCSGDNVLSIEKNEWRVHSGVWDFESVGSRYIFRNSKNDVVLRLRMEAPTLIAIEQLQTVISGIPIAINEHHMKIGGAIFVGNVASGAAVGFSIG